jgi:transposase
VQAHTPGLLDRYGVGPDTAAALLLAAGDNPERLHSPASFVALCGASPIEASSGTTHRLRLNRGGDRQANSAPHTIAIARLRWDTATQANVNRPVTQGKTRREAIRCLKHYIAREMRREITRVHAANQLGEPQGHQARRPPRRHRAPRQHRPLEATVMTGPTPQ